MSHYVGTKKLSAQSRVHQAFGYKQGTIAIHRCTYTSGALWIDRILNDVGKNYSIGKVCLAQLNTGIMIIM